MMMMFDEPPKRRKPSLTPMIDVVFLLLVFFMLSARFGADQVLPMTLGGGTGEYSGPPRLVETGPDGLRLNGVPMPIEALISQLETMVETPEDALILRGIDGANTQAIIDLMSALTAAGYTNLILVE